MRLIWRIRKGGGRERRGRTRSEEKKNELGVIWTSALAFLLSTVSLKPSGLIVRTRGGSAQVSMNRGLDWRPSSWGRVGVVASSIFLKMPVDKVRSNDEESEFMERKGRVHVRGEEER